MKTIKLFSRIVLPFNHKKTRQSLRRAGQVFRTKNLQFNKFATLNSITTTYP